MCGAVLGPHTHKADALLLSDSPASALANFSFGMPGMGPRASHSRVCPLPLNCGPTPKTFFFFNWFWGHCLLDSGFSSGGFIRDAGNSGWLCARRVSYSVVLALGHSTPRRYLFLGQQVRAVHLSMAHGECPESLSRSPQTVQAGGHTHCWETYGGR